MEGRGGGRIAEDMKTFLSILILTLLLPVFASQFRPDADTLKKLELGFPGWQRTTSQAYRLPGNLPLSTAWHVVFTRDIAVRNDKEKNRRAKGMLVVYLLPQNGKLLPEKDAATMLKYFDWKTSKNDLEQYEMYLGAGRGYYWYAKTDIGRLNFLKESMKLTGGEDMMQKMAAALNEEDFELYSSRVAVEYFRNQGDSAVPYILQSVKEWEQEHEKESEVPLPHLFALKLAGGRKAEDALMQFAYSRNRRVAEAAIGRLLTEPCTAPDKFYVTVMRLPMFTGAALDVFRKRKKGKMILGDLQKLAARPKSLQQYSLVAAALREFGKGMATVPEYDSANHIMFRVMRKGDTPDTPIFVTFDDTTLISESAMETAERKRIEEFTKQLLTSSDREAAIIAALSLATYNPQTKGISEAYIKRVRRIGGELLRKMPIGPRQQIFQLLDKNLTDTRDRASLRRVASEIGMRL